MKKQLFNGVATAIVTPFTKGGGGVDFKSFGRIIEAQIESGVAALVVLGTTGEAITVSDSERRAIVRFAVDLVARRVPVIVGIGGNNPDTIVRYGIEARQAGAHGVMITAPFYNKTTQAGLVTHFEEMARRIRMPIIAYNVPGRAGMNILPATMAEMAGRIKWVVGIKESSGDIEQIQEVARLLGMDDSTKKRVALYCGDDGMALAGYAVGCVGLISVASNVRPRECAQVWELFKKRKVREARELFLSQLPLYGALFCEVNPIPVKYMLAREGWCLDEVRLPLVPLSEQGRRLIESAY